MAAQEFISRSQARTQGLKFFFDGQPCGRGHMTGRYVSNGACVTCTVDKEYKKTPVAARKRKKVRSDTILRKGHEKSVVKMTAALAPTKAPAPAAPDSADDLIGDAEFISRLPFAWTAEKRTKLIETFIDTGDIATARDAIGVSASRYYLELNENSGFNAAIAEATPLARQHLKERAMQLGLRGNDKLLIAVLKAEFPEFRDAIKVDMQHSVRKLSNDEIDQRLEQLSRGLIIDGRFTVVEPDEEDSTSDVAGREGSPAESEQNSDDLPG